MNAKVDAFIRRAKTWREETEALRAILLDCGLTEALKWGKPCYTNQDSNVAIVQGFKEHCTLMFFKGALLKDPKGILKKPGENSHVARRIEFTNSQEISALEPVLKAYIREAMEIEKAGLKVTSKAKLVFPEEFQKRLDADPELRTAFEALTPGRQRGYNLSFSSTKRSKTRESRIDKCVDRILDGKGLDDR